MITRITTTLTAALAALYTLAGAAVALPGERYGVDPYGIPIREGLPAVDPVVQTTMTGMALSPFVLVAAIVVTAAVTALVGYRAGAVHRRRLALR